MSQNGPTPVREQKPPTDEELRSAIPRGLRRRELKVGLFVLAGVVSVIVSLFLLTDPATFRGRYLITTLVDNAGGIRSGDPVQMRGVNIGRVHSFSLEDDGVEVTLEIEGEWEIPSDSRTRLVSSGILGGRTVEIVEGASPERARRGDRLPGQTMDGILDFPPDLGRDAQEVLRQVQGLLSAPTVGAIEEGALELRTLLAGLSDLVQAQGEEVSRLTASLNRSAQGLEDAAGSGDDFARAIARADSTLLAVNRTSEVLHRAAGALDTILGRIERGEGTLGQLSANSDLYETLTEAAESVELLLTDIRENPGRYLKVEIF
jgi:phospholipid/cholesterol/gamma-HCH transport system substrate-binding protein